MAVTCSRWSTTGSYYCKHIGNCNEYSPLELLRLALEQIKHLPCWLVHAALCSKQNTQPRKQGHLRCTAPTARPSLGKTLCTWLRTAGTPYSITLVQIVTLQDITRLSSCCDHTTCTAAGAVAAVALVDAAHTTMTMS